jgi:hypothetical protein
MTKHQKLGSGSQRLTYQDIDRLSLGHARELLRLAPMLMGVRMASVFSNTFIGPLPANANETLMFTTGPLGLAVDNAPVMLFFIGTVVAGTSTTSHNYRLRRGTLVTSPLIHTAAFAQTCAAGNTVVVSGCYFDLPGVAAGLQYSLTIAQAAATVAGVFSDGALLAMVL